MLRWRPEWPFTVLVGIAWMALLSKADAASSSSMVHMGAVSNLVGQHRGHMFDVMSWCDALVEWGLMSVAMMLPVTLPAIRHVALNSLRPRRHRAMALYVTVFIGMWVGFGALILAVDRWMRNTMAVDERLPLTIALLTAAAWQVSTFKRRAVFQCRRTVPLPPVGLRADAACARFAWRHGWRCLISCWALMVVMALGSHGGMWLMVAVTVLTLLEELTRFGPRLFRPSAAVLACSAGAVVLWI
jgi:predicted metal-binding membrane protein